MIFANFISDIVGSLCSGLFWIMLLIGVILYLFNSNGEKGGGSAVSHRPPAPPAAPQVQKIATSLAASLVVAGVKAWFGHHHGHHHRHE